MRMRWLDYLVIAYGVLLIAMAIDGFLKGSVISLISGGLAGVIAIGLALYTPTNPRVGRIGSAVIALLILGRFGPAYFKLHKPSSLVLAAGSLIVFVCLMGGHFYAMSKRKAAAGSA